MSQSLISRCNSTSKLCRKTLHLLRNMAKNFDNIVYKSLDSILEQLNKPEFQSLSEIEKLLEIYQEVSANETELSGKKHPLIVLEGLDGCGKSTITKRLSNTLDAVLFCTPPPCIKVLREKFDSSEYKEVRTAYYSLGNYIAAIQIKELLQTRPVVLDRFWHSTAAYGVAQTIADYPGEYSLPPEGDPIYTWPEDLLKPEVVAFLCVSEQARLQRLKNRVELTTQENLLKSQEKFRSDVVAVYNRIVPKMKYINAHLSKRKVEDQILEHVRPFIPNL